MILNGVKTTVVDSAAASLAAGAVVGGVALAAGALAVATPAVAGAAIAAGALVVSAKVCGFIRGAIFKSRAEDLEQHAKSLGLNPDAIVVNCKTDQEGDDFSVEHPRRLSHLIEDKDMVKWSVEKIGLPTDHYRLSREQVAQAKASMRALAAEQGVAPSAPKATVKVMASVSDYGFSTKAERGLEGANEGVPSALQAAKAALDRFASRLGVSLGGTPVEVSKRIEASHGARAETAVPVQRKPSSGAALEM